MHNAPGKHYRKGISLLQITAMFPDNAAAEQWFTATRWPDGPACPHCGSDNILTIKNRKPQPYRCRDCRKHFSVKVGTLMEGSNLGLRIWAIAFYLLATGIKGTASMKLHRDLGVTQKTAWHLAHRIRETWRGNDDAPFEGPVEADESYFGGKAKNMHADKRAKLTGRGGVDKAAVAGVRDRATGKVRARVVKRVDGATLKPFVRTAAPGAKVYTDEASAYDGLPDRESVKHGVGQYVDGQAHTNGLESFWGLMKRGYHGTYHRMSEKHLPRYVAEFEGRHNQRPLDTPQRRQPDHVHRRQPAGAPRVQLGERRSRVPRPAVQLESGLRRAHREQGCRRRVQGHVDPERR